MGYFWEFLWFRLSWDKRALTCKSMVRSVRNKVRRGHNLLFKNECKVGAWQFECEGGKVEKVNLSLKFGEF